MLKYFIFLQIICIVSGKKSLIVKSTIGLVRGLNDNGIIKFLGIPYAMVNRTNRFGISTPYTLKTEFNATQYKSKDLCDKTHNDITNSFDCLFLNIYKPETSKNRLPIVIFMYSDKNHEKLRYSTYFSLLKSNHIVVKMYYRSGIYGFMCLNSPLVPGNQGIKDMELGLKWVEENMKAFGGNPDQISVINEDKNIDLSFIYGERNISDTKTKVSLFKFDRLVVTTKDAQKPDDSVPKRLSMELGCESNDTADALMFLSTINEAYVNKASKKLNITYKVCAISDGVVENNAFGTFLNGFNDMMKTINRLLSLIGIM